MWAVLGEGVPPGLVSLALLKDVYLATFNNVQAHAIALHGKYHFFIKTAL